MGLIEKQKWVWFEMKRILFGYFYIGFVLSLERKRFRDALTIFSYIMMKGRKINAKKKPKNYRCHWISCLVLPS